MSSVMDAARMVADLGIDNRNEVYAPNADAKGNIAPINPAEEQAKRDGALQHRAAARSTGSAQIAGWYNPDNFEDHSGGTENICAGQAHRPVAFEYQAVTTPAVSGPSTRTADPRSMGGIKDVNGIRTVIPPTTGAASRSLASNGATTRAAAAGPASRQPTSTGKTIGTSAFKSRLPPANAPRAPRAHGESSHTSRGRNNGPPLARGVHIGVTADDTVAYAMQILTEAAKNGTLGPNFLPERFLPTTQNMDAPDVTRAKLRITAAAFDSATPTEFIVEKEFLDIFKHARKFLVNGTFNLILGSTEKAREKHLELYKGFEFENGLYAFAMRAFKDLRTGNSEFREKLRADFESEDQLDVMEQALQIIAIKGTVFGSSGDRKTFTPSPGDNEDKTDMSSKVTTTIEQTAETVDPAVTDAQQYGITATATGPASSTANVYAPFQQAAATMGNIDYSLTTAGDSSLAASGDADIFPPGVRATLTIEFDNADRTCTHMSDPSALIQSLQALVALLQGQYEKHQMEYILATVHGINHSAAQGEQQSEGFEQATASSSPAPDESVLVHHSESVGD